MITPVRFGDLCREYAEIGAEIDAALARVLRRGWFVLGPEVEAIEQAFAEFVGVQHGVGCASGTEAIALALMAAGVQPGDDVVTVAHTAVPTATGIEMAGGVPVFVDICADTCLMDVTQVESAIGQRTGAILPVHLYGQCVDMEPLLALGRKYAVPVIEDCAQAHGAVYGRRTAGSMGIASAFSFYPSKNLGCYGDGGMVLTDNPQVAERLRMLRNYGQRERYDHQTKGINSRLDEMQATILLAKLPHLQAWNSRRRAIAAAYDAGLAGLAVQLPQSALPGDHVYHLYVIQVDDRDALQAHLAEHGIQTLVHYPRPVHRQAAFAELGYSVGSLPVTERVAGRILSLPIYPQLKDEEVDRVVAYIRSFFA